MSSLSPDSRLIRAARASDFSAWDNLLKTHQLPLYTYIAELVRNDTTALDLVQDTFAAAVRHLDTLRDDTKFAAWLFGIAHQKCVQHWRRTRRTEERFVDNDSDTFDDFPADPADDPLAQLLRREQADALFALVEKLPLPQRSALLLHVLEDFSLEDIARITAAPLGTVKSRLHHAKRALRILVEETA